jgi:hypothetical protein
MLATLDIFDNYTTAHNNIIWALPEGLSIRVFKLLKPVYSGVRQGRVELLLDNFLIISLVRVFLQLFSIALNVPKRAVVLIICMFTWWRDDSMVQIGLVYFRFEITNDVI